MKIIFFGSSEFSLPALQACVDYGWKPELVISTPDRKKGRGLKVLPTPVKELALEMKLPVQCPESLKDENAISLARNIAPELFVVSSYGKFIPNSWLDIPSRYRLNVHPSLLPKYRGASPLNAPILNGDMQTGLSIADVAPKLDAGDIYFQETYELNDSITALELSNILSKKSYSALHHLFDKIKSGELSGTQQDDSLSSYAPKIEKSMGLFDWTMNSIEIHRKVRAMLPWPTAYFTFRGDAIQVHKTLIPSSTQAGEPGTILSIEKSNGIEVQTASGSISLLNIKPPGKKVMAAYDFANGQRLEPGDLLSL